MEEVDSDDEEISLPDAGASTATVGTCVEEEIEDAGLCVPDPDYGVRKLSVIYSELESKAIDGIKGWFDFHMLDRLDPVETEPEDDDWENASCPDDDVDWLEQEPEEVDEITVDPEDEPSVDGSTGICPPVLTKAGGAEQDEQGKEAIPKPKPESQCGKRKKSSEKWKHPKKLAKLDWRTGEFVKSEVCEKNFDDYTVGELRNVVDGCKVGPPPGHWMDGDAFAGVFEDEGDEGSNDKPLMECSWKSEPESWNAGKWVKVDSVVDSGASTPVAPPTMAPNCTIRPSEGSKRGQKFTSASKHKLKNLGEQRLEACTEDGHETEVLFQIADVSRPLVSVSGICERGNRVIFGRAGGVVQCLKTGRETPFYKRNGIYVLSMWIKDGDSSGFNGR